VVGIDHDDRAMSSEHFGPDHVRAVRRTGTAVRCCKCGGLFEWRDGHFYPAAPVNPALATLLAAGKAVATVGQAVLGLAALAFGMWAVSRDDCDCD
jgi:hypothetical protein